MCSPFVPLVMLLVNLIQSLAEPTLSNSLIDRQTKCQTSCSCLLLPFPPVALIMGLYLICMQGFLLHNHVCVVAKQDHCCNHWWRRDTFDTLRSCTRWLMLHCTGNDLNVVAIFSLLNFHNADSFRPKVDDPLEPHHKSKKWDGKFWQQYSVLITVIISSMECYHYSCWCFKMFPFCFW